MPATRHPAAVTLPPDASLRLALSVFVQTGAEALPVVAEGRYLGAVLREDVCVYAPSPATTLTRWEMPDLLEGVSLAEEGLIRSIPTQPFGAGLEEAAHLMLAHDSRVVAVLDGERLVRLLGWREVLAPPQAEAAPQTPMVASSARARSAAWLLRFSRMTML